MCILPYITYYLVYLSCVSQITKGMKCVSQQSINGKKDLAY